MPEALPPLDYAPAPPGEKHRRALRRAMLWLGVVCALAAVVYYAPPTARQLWYLLAQRRCLSYSPPEGQLAYANDPADATLLLADGAKPVASAVGNTLNTAPSATMSAARLLPPLKDVNEDALGSYARTGSGFLRLSVANAPPRTGAFLHRRSHPGSGERLVGVVFLERRDSPSAPCRLEINALVWRPATMELGSRLTLIGLSTLALTPVDGRRVRIFAGQPDPADAAHFTIPYDIDGASGTLDGWLTPLDKVRLQVRDGP